jgi:hypothetical protein
VSSPFSLDVSSQETAFPMDSATMQMWHSGAYPLAIQCQHPSFTPIHLSRTEPLGATATGGRREGVCKSLSTRSSRARSRPEPAHLFTINSHHQGFTSQSIATMTVATDSRHGRIYS